MKIKLKVTDTDHIETTKGVNDGSKQQFNLSIINISSFADVDRAKKILDTITIESGYLTENFDPFNQFTTSE